MLMQKKDARFEQGHVQILNSVLDMIKSLRVVLKINWIMAF